MPLSYKQQFNKYFDQPLNESNSMKDISELSGMKLSVLKKVYSRGIGAWKSNIRSVRTKGTYKKNENKPRRYKLGKEQWAVARVYAFVMKIILDKNLNHDNDLEEKL